MKHALCWFFQMTLIM